MADDIVSVLVAERVPGAEAAQLAARVAEGGNLAVVASAIAAAYPAEQGRLALRWGVKLSRSALLRVTQPRDVSAVFDTLHDALHPAFCISAIGESDMHDELEDIESLRELVQAMPAAKLKAMIKRAPPHLRQQIEAVVAHIQQETNARHR